MYRIFEKKIGNNSIIIVSDYTKVLVSFDYRSYRPDKETAYFVSYTDNENIAYAYITTFEKLWVLQTVTKLDVR